MPSRDADWQRFCQNLFSRNEHTIKLGLDRVHAALRRLGNPQSSLRVCTVAGTNGKGTTAALTSWWLSRAGVRTGLYTSPHLLDFTERFRVDGSPVSREQVMVAGRRVLAAGPDLTFFEVTTLIALLVFEAEGVEVAVLEVGLGGRLDAVNAVDPDLVGITSIALDHAAYLGDTLGEVAAEKAAVMRAGVPVVWAEQTEAALAVLRGHAERVGAVVVPPDAAVGLPGWLAGAFAGNVGVARALARELGVEELGLDGFRWPGRRDDSLPGFLLDVAHNPAGAAGLAAHLAADPPTVGVLGVSSDKDVAGMVAEFRSLPTQWILTVARSPRAMTLEQLRAASAGLDVVGCAPDIDAALVLAAAFPGPVLVTGSVYLMGDFLQAVGAGPAFFSLSRASS